MKLGVWKVALRTEAHAVMGRGPISSSWVDTNKGDEQNPVYRSRLVVTRPNA